MDANFAEFLALPEDERFKILCDRAGITLHWWQRSWIIYCNKWWTHMCKTNPHLKPEILWMSIYKGRF